MSDKAKQDRSWQVVLEEKAHDLDLIASWASQVNQGRVRDWCRLAASQLREEAKRFDEMQAGAAG